MAGQDQGGVKTEIPDDVIADAVAAVEKHASGASTPPEDAGDAQRERQTDGAAPTPPDAVDVHRERMEQAERECEAARAELAAERDLRLRALADLDNFRKRVARERDQVQRFGAEALVRDLLPVLDNMDRALAALPEGPLATGVAMTQRHLEETLKRHGLKPFEVAPGTGFDPHVHEAVTTAASAEHPVGAIVAQQLRGYFLHDRLLRPAAVVVASGPAAEPAGDAATTAPGGADAGGSEEHGA